MSIEPAKRVIAVALNIRSNDGASARFAGFDRFPDAILGLAPPGFMLASAPRTLRIRSRFNGLTKRRDIADFDGNRTHSR
jgi:hypothetical protein